MKEPLSDFLYHVTTPFSYFFRRSLVHLPEPSIYKRTLNIECGVRKMELFPYNALTREHLDKESKEEMNRREMAI